MDPVSQDPRPSRRSSLLKGDTNIALKRATLWREEASKVGFGPNDMDNMEADTGQTTSYSGALKRPAEDVSSDYFRVLEEAVKKRKMMGMNTTDMAPLLSMDTVFTQAIPSGMASKIFCTAPSNRIGIYFSPEAAELGAINASEKIPIKRVFASDLKKPYTFTKSRREPWKPSDTRPVSPSRGYWAPVFDQPVMTHPMPPEIAYSAHERRHSKLENGLDGSPKSTHYNPHLEIEIESSKLDHGSKEKAEDSGVLVENESTSKSRFFPKIVDTPRSLQEESLQRPAIPKNIMRIAEDILKYQLYIQHGIDDRFIAPMRDRWSRNAVHLVGKYVKRGLSEEIVQRTLREVLDEVQHEYALSMRKAIFDYILQDHAERERLGLTDIENIVRVVTTGFVGRAPTMQILSPEWREAVLNAHGLVVGGLHKLNPQALELAFLWQDLFADKTFLDTKSADFCANMPYDLAVFISREEQCATSVREAIETDWLSMATAVLNQAVPIPPNSDTSRFFEAMAVLMGNQIRKLAEDSVVLYASFFNVFRNKIEPGADGEPIPLKFRKLFTACSEIPSEIYLRNAPPFKVTLKYMDGVYSIDPSFEKLEEGIMRVLDFSITQSSGIPRVDADKVDPSSSKLPSMTTEDELVRVAKRHIKQVVFSNIEGPRGLMESFTEFQDLADLTPEAFASEFGSQERPLSEYEEMINKFKEREDMAKVASANEVDCGFVRVLCEEYKDILIQKAKLVQLLLKEQVLFHMNAANTNVIERMEHIARELTKHPTNSDEAVHLRKFLGSCPAELGALDRLLSENRQREEFLDRYLLNVPETEFRTMLIAYEWPKRVRAVIDVHTKRITEEYELYEGVLKKRRLEFFDVLERLDKQTKAYELIGDIERTDIIAQEAKELSHNLEEAQANADSINAEEVLFGVPPTKITQVQQLVSLLDPFLKLWTVASQFRKSEEEWMTVPFFSVDSEKVENEVTTMWRVIYKLVKQFGEVYVEPGKVAVAVQASIDRFKENLRLIRCLSNPGLRARHFEKISEAVGFEIKAEDPISFRQLLRLQIDEHLLKLEEISEHASKEYSLERTLDSMSADWEPLKFEYTSYKATGSYILKGGPIEEAQILLEEHIVKTQNLYASPFAQFFSERIASWLRTITLIQNILREWLKMQAAWMYLEPIFGSADILEQMPKEGTAFHTVDKVWRRIVDSVVKTNSMLEAATIPDLLEDLTTGNELLDVVQKGLNQYLETKRLAFPRFFFLSNDELLEILSETKDPLRVQPFLKKCFEGINTLEFQKNLDITAMLSVEQERVGFTRTTNPKSAGGNVERWLIEVEAMMKESLKVIVQQATADYAVEPREKWILKWPGMVVLCGSQIHWTREVADAISVGGSAALKDYEDKCTSQLHTLVKLVRGEITNMERLTIGALVVIDVHARDVVTLLKERSVSSDTDFEWLSQLRYYLEDGEVCT